ncbi:TolC family protein, partial [candidate division NPL-UPA2 bacterium]|nr:TolC family protein [candidate division NPL-UPA2 bacterium]
MRRAILTCLMLLIYILIDEPGAQVLGEGSKDKLSLRDCIKIALTNSPEVEIGRESVRDAREGIRESQAAYWPKVSFATKVAFEEKEGDSCWSEISARWDIFDKGKRASALKKAEDYLSSQWQKRLISQEIIYRTADAYIRRLHAEERYLLAKEVLAWEERRKETVKAKSEEGLVPKLDVVSVEIEIHQAQISLAKAFSDLKMKGFLLNYAMGLDMDKAVEIEEINYPRWKVLIDEYEKIEDCFKRAFLNRLDYKIAGSKLRAAEANLKSARAEAGPDIFLETHYGFPPQSGAENGDFFIGLTLDLPLFDGGLRKARIERAKAQVKIAQLEREMLKRKIYKQIANAHEKLKNRGMHLTPVVIISCHLGGS